MKSVFRIRARFDFGVRRVANAAFEISLGAPCTGPVSGLRQGRRRDVNRLAAASLSGGAYSAFKADPDSMMRSTALSLIRKSEAGDA